MTKLLTIALALFLAGCAQTQPYQNAPEADSAKLRLRIEEPVISNLYLLSVDAEKCQLGSAFGWVSGGVDTFYKEHLVAMLGDQAPREGVLQFRIPAGKPLAARPLLHNAKLNAAQILFSMNVATQGEVRSAQPGTCPAPAFMPRAGEEYEMVYRVKPGRCETNIYRLSLGTGGVSRTDITHDLNLTVLNGTSEKDVMCRPPQAPPAAKS